MNAIIVAAIVAALSTLTVPVLKHWLKARRKKKAQPAKEKNTPAGNASQSSAERMAQNPTLGHTEKQSLPYTDKPPGVRDWRN